MIPSSGKTLKYLFSLICLVFSITLTAQTSELALRPTPQPALSPAVAYLYVTQQNYALGPSDVSGFVVHQNGSLTPIEGSPFQANVVSMAVNGKYLFGANNNNLSIDTYTIEPGGALRYVVSNYIEQMPGESGGGTDTLFLDHTGATLYDDKEYEDGNGALESFAINKATGTLALTPGYQWLSGAQAEADYTVGANDEYVYVASPNYPPSDVGTLKREGNGSLLTSWPGKEPNPLPVPRPNEAFVPQLISADPLNHVAVSFYRMQEDDGPGYFVGSMQLGVYTADAIGNLTTTSTYKNMPTTIFRPLNMVEMRMSPSGKLLAVTGLQGLQVFHFNGGDPITHYANFTTGGISHISWDNYNHLFAIGFSGVYVFTATPTSFEQAPGSPYSIPNNPYRMIVQPLPLD